MLLSRFWYVVLALCLGAAAFVLFVAAQLYNRAGNRAMSEALSADSSAVEWYLKDDARKRSSALIPIALHADVRAGLAKLSGEAKPPRDVREKTRSALRKLADEVPADTKFDALWAVDAGGRVMAAVGYEHTDDWELGGYAVVADALHGWIRDDAWVWKGRIYRIVARPVEQEVNGEPVGAIIGAKIVDDNFARAVSKRTGAALGFYAEGTRVASWAPEGFDKSNLDQITQDLKQLDDNKDYQEKGRSEPRVLGEHLGVVYARMPGEAWDLGAGFAVGRLAVSVASPTDFLNKADNDDKKNVPTPIIVIVTLLAAVLGIAFSFLEHDRPLIVFHAESMRFAKGETDTLQPSKFRGIYKKIASDVNDGVEKAAAKGGAPRRTADLQQVLGKIPAQPAMAAFSMPGAGGPDGPSPAPDARPKPPPPGQRFAKKPGPPGRTSDPESPPSQRKKPPPPGGKAAEEVEPEQAAEPAEAAAEPANEAAGAPAEAKPEAAPAGEGDELAEWQKVYEAFLALKKECGEPTENMTFEKFKGTLQRNKDALAARHGSARVKFTVYVKEGKAALKASPIK